MQLKLFEKNECQIESVKQCKNTWNKKAMHYQDTLRNNVDCS